MKDVSSHKSHIMRPQSRIGEKYMGYWNVIRHLVIGLLIFLVLATLVHPAFLLEYAGITEPLIGQIAVWIVALIVGLVTGLAGREAYVSRVVDGIFVGAGGTVVSFGVLGLLIASFDITADAMGFLSYLVINALLCGLGAALSGFFFAKRVSS